MNIIELAQRIPDDAAAYEYLEELRWQGQPVCPHCGSIGQHYFLKSQSPEGRKTRTGSRSQRRVWKCRDCRKQFSVLTGTIFHGTKISLRKWLFVIFEMCASKNGVAAREIERKYGLTPKSAWFMVHRIREAMKREPLASMLNGTVVADETWIGGKPSNRHGHKRGQGGQGVTDKTPVLALVDAETGEVRSAVVPDVTGATLRKTIAEQVDIGTTTLHTDSARSYQSIAGEFLAHESVDHSAGEYVRGRVSTNKAENFFSQLKRSIDGTHHHVSVEHLPRYLAEFDFRYSTRDMTDTERMDVLVDRVHGRRLTYKPMREQR
jgi:transposase-like protein